MDIAIQVIIGFITYGLIKQQLPPDVELNLPISIIIAVALAAAYVNGWVKGRRDYRK